MMQQASAQLLATSALQQTGMMQAEIPSTLIFRVGHNHIYTVHIRYFWQGITIYTVYIYGSGQLYSYWSAKSAATG